MDKLNQDENDLLQRIANRLILNVSCLNNLGLYHGKMGAVLFLLTTLVIQAMNYTITLQESY